MLLFNAIVCLRRIFGLVKIKWKFISHFSFHMLSVGWAIVVFGIGGQASLFLPQFFGNFVGKVEILISTQIVNKNRKLKVFHVFTMDRSQAGRWSLLFISNTILTVWLIVLDSHHLDLNSSAKKKIKKLNPRNDEHELQTKCQCSDLPHHIHIKK